MSVPRPDAIDFGKFRLSHPGTVYANLSPTALVTLAIQRQEGQFSDRGALVTRTGRHTGRSPRDRFLVVDAAEEGLIDWGPINQRMSDAACDRLLGRMLDHLQGRELFVVDASACADPAYAVGVRVVADLAWHALLSKCLFRDASFSGRLPADTPDGLTILCASGFHADPAIDGTHSETFIVLNLPRRLILIGGTGYAGEIKKAVFSYLNYQLPGLGVFPMHCSANVGADRRSALFFGLSGTGKTTLSADPERRLIGDDEHAWTRSGVVNIEGGCYAKCIRLSAEGEPQIYSALRFGSVLENVVLDPDTGRPDFDDESLTENTRAAYPLDFIPRAQLTGQAGHPDTVIFLTCDAFGVIPPLSRLSVDQAMYHFLSGYTAKMAGTEMGVRDPEATFSTCFAAPFLPLHPGRYADLLAARVAEHGSRVWLINTGWVGGAAGAGGRRIALAHTRTMVRAVLTGDLDDVPCEADPVFRVGVPRSCPGVPQELLRPAAAWGDAAAYQGKAKELAARFASNFAKYAEQVSEAVRLAGPRVG